MSPRRAPHRRRVYPARSPAPPADELRLEIALGALRLSAPIAVRTPDEAPPARDEPPDAYWRRYEPDPDRSAVFVSGATLERRRVSRLFYWNREAQRSNGEVFVTSGDVRWRDGLREGMEALRKGLTWRLGSGFWTLLDTSLPLEIAGVPVPVGLHYLGVDRSPDGARWSLALLDPHAVRAMRIDAFETEIRAMPVALEIPLAFEEGLAVSSELRLRLDAHESDPRSAGLELRFGPYRLTAPIRLLEMPALGEALEAASGG